MRYKHTICGALILGFVIWAGVSVSAQNSKLFDRVGVLDAQNAGQGSVVIYDVIYNVHKNTKVYLFNPEVDNTKLKNREEASLETLTPGMTLGYTVTSNGNSHPSRIKEIWILPKESVAAMDSEEGEKKN